MSYYRSLTETKNPEEALSLLSQYLDAVKFLALTDTESSGNVLSYLDLYFDNVFVNPETHQITRIADWQGVTVALLFFHTDVPTVFRYDGYLLIGTWESKGLLSLRQRPVSLSEQELELHRKEEENMDSVGQMLKVLRDEGMLSADGMFHLRDYDVAVENVKKFRRAFIGLTKDDEERHRVSRLWPYQADG
ncbi:hypothetical protein CIRG_00625 [Coccidioides immitis RMSCC 2394]|uniref:Aminoglycoside phosphotransferase domain-containing protein n=1 Tax=Coccidioides immitis RMSCC 2394 TaxID=404692 RepID=A0A0J6Y1I3_COCIT|nr:hypothetical protein CIRG_00625 [Coccidioides immitis RMSCC 2394]